MYLVKLTGNKKSFTNYKKYQNLRQNKIILGKDHYLDVARYLP